MSSRKRLEDAWAYAKICYRRSEIRRVLPEAITFRVPDKERGVPKVLCRSLKTQQGYPLFGGNARLNELGIAIVSYGGIMRILKPLAVGFTIMAAFAGSGNARPVSSRDVSRDTGNVSSGPDQYPPITANVGSNDAHGAPSIAASPQAGASSSSRTQSPGLTHSTESSGVGNVSGATDTPWSPLKRSLLLPIPDDPGSRCRWDWNCGKAVTAGVVGGVGAFSIVVGAACISRRNAYRRAQNAPWITLQPYTGNQPNQILEDARLYRPAAVYQPQGR
jgi:hypothetical protein